MEGDREPLENPVTGPAVLFAMSVGPPATDDVDGVQGNRPQALNVSTVTGRKSAPAASQALRAASSLAGCMKGHARI